MVDETFITNWQQCYAKEKYSKELYFSSINTITENNNALEVARAIINMLHWKDGKVSFVNGEYLYGKTKPNTYNELKHKPIFESHEFFAWVRETNKNTEFRAESFYKLQKFGLWSKNSVVLPTFILHIVNPFVYPLYDQHVDRAMRGLLGTLEDDKKPSFNSYIEYKNFFDTLKQENEINTIKRIDEALWAYGKIIKKDRNLRAVTSEKTTTDRIEIYSNSDMNKSQISENCYKPDLEFKKRVLALISDGLKHGMAMRLAAEKKGVILSESYYKYPSSHVNRWREQIKIS